MKSEAKFFASQAWVEGAWAYEVLLEVDDTGHWSKVQVNATAEARTGARLLQGYVFASYTESNTTRIPKFSVNIGHKR